MIKEKHHGVFAEEPQLFDFFRLDPLFPYEKQDRQRKNEQIAQAGDDVDRFRNAFDKVEDRTNKTDAMEDHKEKRCAAHPRIDHIGMFAFDFFLRGKEPPYRTARKDKRDRR